MMILQVTCLVARGKVFRGFSCGEICLNRRYSFRSSETSEFRSCKRKCCSDEYRTDTLESIIERARITPVRCPIYNSTGGSTDIDNDTENNKADNCSNLDDRENELHFTVSPNTDQINNDNHQPKDCDKHGAGNIRVPELNRQSSSHKFERKHGHPPHGIVPTHRKTPCRIDKPRREDRERSCTSVFPQVKGPP